MVILSLFASGVLMLTGCATDDNETSIIDPMDAAAPIVQPPCARYSPGIPENSLADTPAAL